MGSFMSSTTLFIILIFPSLVAGIVLLLFWLRARQRQHSLQAELAASEARRSQMVSVADLAMVILDERFCVVDWSPAMERLYGCKLEQALGQQFFLRFAPPSEGATLTARAMTMRKSSEVFSFTFAVPVENGSPRIVHWRANYCMSGVDESICLTLIGNDVTALENALTELSVSEYRLRTVFESVPGALALVDPEGSLRMVNPACAAFFGYEAPEMMVALSVSDLVHPDDRATTLLAIAALRAHTEPLYQRETRYLCKNGEVRWGYAQGVLVELSPGQSFFLAQITDIHERKQIEQELLESERRLATLISNLSGMVYRYQFAPSYQGLHHEQLPTFISDGVELITGCIAEDFSAKKAGKTLAHFIPEEDRGPLLAALERAKKGDGRFKVSYRLLCALKNTRWVSEHGLVWQRPDGSWSVDGHITDITAERQALDDAQVYRTLVADTHTGYLCLTEKGYIVEANQPYCTMFGVTEPTEIQGRLLEDIFPSHMLLIRGFLQVVLREGGVHDAELVYKLPNGKSVYALTSAIAVEENGQRLIKSLLIDITKTRRAERERQETEQRYRTLFETSLAGICFVSLEGRVEEANAALYQLLGMVEAEKGLVGMDMYNLTASAWNEADNKAKSQLLSQGWSEPYRKEFKRQDGSSVPVSIQSWLVRDENGNPLRVMSMATDISSLCHLLSEKEVMQKSLECLDKELE